MQLLGSATATAHMSTGEVDSLLTKRRDRYIYIWTGNLIYLQLLPSHSLLVLLSVSHGTVFFLLNIYNLVKLTAKIDLLRYISQAEVVPIT